ncbi:AAA family ATPase [Georgenia faecalis]|uniref:Nuclease SbcCD subunit C n=1 Tax=Georgenia faecalis TaxID=2483799 RepID=A0ABV9DDQ9_9MICO
MRVHRLTLQAIGPFPGRHEIDVDRLSAGGLFLLEGPTGAGKSTIIDAVVFALYGSVASSETSEDRLPSAHAPADAEPFVELTFSTGAGIHRVRRSPKYARPKRRGDGVTTQNATAKLWRLAAVDDAAGEPMAATTQEVGTEIGRIVGLDRSQFTQTVVLPQGQFAAFLRAKPEQRRAVLQDVFGTEVYERVQHQLAAMAKEARSELGRAAEDIRAAASGFVVAAELDEDRTARLEAAARDLAAEALTEEVERACAEADQRAASATAAEEAAREAERSAQRRLDTERDLAVRLARRGALLAEQHALAERTSDVEVAERRLASAQRAAGTTSALRAQADAGARAADAAQALALRLAEVAAGEHADLATLVPVDPEQAERDHLVRVRAAAHDAAAERGALSDVLDLEAGLPARAARLAADREACGAEATVLAAPAADLAQRPAERAALHARAATTRAAAAERSGARAAHARTEEVLLAARAWEDRQRAHGSARERLARAALAARKAQQAEHETRMRWIAGLAGELATQLEEGEACPVCGSAEHPEPARPTAAHASAEEVEATTAARVAAEEVLSAANATDAALAAEVTALAAAAGGRDVPAATADRDRAATALATAEQASRDLDVLEREIAGFDARTAALEAALAGDRTEVAAREAGLAAEAAQLARDTEHCRRARGEAASVAARAADLARRVAAAHRLAEALEEHLEAARSATAASEALARTLAERDFADAATARAALLDDVTAHRLSREITDHRAALGRVAAGLAEAPIASLTGEESADVPAATLTHRAAQEHLTAATRQAVEARGCAQRSASARAVLTAGLGAHAARARAAAPVLRMAALATAAEGNASSMTLATFVLLRRFEDVVAAANERLGAMSDGRYSLERIDEREGGQRSRKAGLGLAVRDHVTERARDPHTLSGGETFYVSLSLALGLADVVTSEAGGIALDTLFVDEGFGSLDPQTLDDVMGELSRLQAGGRAVGIVSHVTELKSRIAERIEVRRLPGGASTLTVRC